MFLGKGRWVIILLFHTCLFLSSQGWSEAIAVEPAQANPQKLIVFSCAMGDSHPALKTWSDFYSRVFGALGYRFQMVSVTMERAVSELVRGTFDGNCGLPFTPESPDPETFFKVDTPIAHFGIQLVSMRGEVHYDSMDQLPSGAIVAYFRGLEVLVPDLFTAHNVKYIPVNASQNSIKLVVAGRADFYLRAITTSPEVFREPGFENDFYVVGAWNQFPLFPYLNIRHLNIKDAFERAYVRELPSLPQTL